jgi:nitroreductase
MFIDLLRQRRSIRKFLDKPIEREKVNELIEAALRSPSSRGLNPWQFIIVDNKTLLETLSASKQHGSSFLKGAPLAIIVCADDSVETWVEDCSIASILIQLSAESMGLKSCWIQIRDRQHDRLTSSREFIAEHVNLPANINVEAIIAIGYSDEVKQPHTLEKLQFEKIWLNAYGQPMH